MMPGPRRGASLAEVMVAIVVLSIMGVGLARNMSQTGSTVQLEQHRATAIYLGQNAIEHARALSPELLAPPAPATEAVDSVRVNSRGDEDPNGLYRLRRVRRLECLGIPAAGEIPSSLDPAGTLCPGERPVLTVSVTVHHPRPAGYDTRRDSVSLTWSTGTSLTQDR